MTQLRPTLPLQNPTFLDDTFARQSLTSPHLNSASQYRTTPDFTMTVLYSTNQRPDITSHRRCKTLRHVTIAAQYKALTLLCIAVHYHTLASHDLTVHYLCFAILGVTTTRQFVTQSYITFALQDLATLCLCFAFHCETHLCLCHTKPSQTPPGCTLTLRNITKPQQSPTSQFRYFISSQVKDPLPVDRFSLIAFEIVQGAIPKYAAASLTD